MKIEQAVSFNKLHFNLDKDRYKKIKTLGYNLALLIAQDRLTQEKVIRDIEAKFNQTEAQLLISTIRFPNDILTCAQLTLKESLKKENIQEIKIHIPEKSKITEYRLYGLKNLISEIDVKNKILQIQQLNKNKANMNKIIRI